jgi:hypothetical protein
MFRPSLALAVFVPLFSTPPEAQARPPKEVEDRCLSLSRAADAAFTKRHHLVELIETIGGRRTPLGREDMGAFSERLAALAGPCSGFPDAGTICREVRDTLFHSLDVDNRPVDVCTAALAADATRAAVLGRALGQIRFPAPKDPPELREGWLPEQGPLLWSTFFATSEKRIAHVRAQATELYEALGMPVPADMSDLWADESAWHDARKAMLAEHFDRWPLVATDCRGYTCDLAKAVVKGQHPQARVIAVRSDNDWNVITHKATGAPLRRRVNIFVAYQVPGEPACQVRAVDVVEQHQGGGVYSRATKPEVNYVRFQRCS